MFDMLKSSLTQAVPFAKYVGIELLDIGPGSSQARLTPRPELLNHIGTMHAAAMFAVAETASGAAVAGAFIELIGAIRPVAAEATVTYMKLARGVVNCTAETSEPANELVRRLHDEHKIVFDVLVAMVDDEGQRLATMSVSWNVRLVAA